MNNPPRPRHWLETPGGGIRPCGLMEWARMMEDGTDARRVAVDEGEFARVSTVFLGLDHNWNPDINAAPLVYETMVFGGPGDGEQARYHSREAALAGHAEMCRRWLGREPGEG
jgi:hypothetical protein